ncbi:CBS domain-containing protein [Anaerobranca californiensis DSM 14826]|uniref:CBS domain-containing protein n=1 Tax=Anaerobranca californiensis DSM 14826 TaxID=1120989 RepID=A0A1M6PIW7_9FIRM|nr:CBS domain-containing protein [Anaerobranca californiensis]SHK07866.1 CBS domain-containing protein [Anaerobranca californiensis DSM 14826]
MLVKDVMTKEVYTVNSKATLRDVAYLLAVHGVGGFPVVDDRGTLIGIITDKEVYKPKEQISLDNDLLLGSLLNLRNPQRFISELADSADLPVISVMISNPITIQENASIKEAMQVLYENNIGRLPVVNESGYLVGIITKGDISRVIEK